MKEAPYNKPIRRAGVAAGMVAASAVLAWFAFFPGSVVYIRALTRPLVVVPVLLPAFSAHLPALAVWWAANIALSVTHLILGRWTALTWLVDLLIRFYGLTVLVRMAAGPAFVTPDWLDSITRLLLGLAALGLLAALVVDVLRGARYLAGSQPTGTNPD